jgi:hypothetical protein
LYKLHATWRGDRLGAAASVAGALRSARDACARHRLVAARALG